MILIYSLVLSGIPIIMLAVGLVWNKNPPTEVNRWYGYRTKRSMKNLDTWIYAHQFIASLWVYFGINLGIISFIMLFLCRNFDQDGLSYAVLLITFIQLFALCTPNVLTERALDVDGKRKEKANS